MNAARALLRVTQILRSSSHSYKRAAATQYYLSSTLANRVAGINSAEKPKQQQTFRYFSNQNEVDSCLDSVTYERVCSETLDALSDYFDELTENATDVAGTDVGYGDGVLTVNLGQDHGTYVINRQTPNKQIWLSSPTSGPKRFDFIGTPGNGTNTGKWIYKHSGESLHELLQLEIGQIFKTQNVNFMELPYCS
ncbi:frataxin homolog, mitochondrial [Drosophila innubila]|uniref:frataxin homolog, mitochondrial n=1 Tax=Drosophila innubila TaxID=198719 RepID=UPI00148E75A8|nr:frataxin homolog, mitochondrial [Drosophila innubila]